MDSGTALGELCLGFLSLQNFFAFIRATGRTGTMGKLGSLALGTSGDSGCGQKIMRPSHILAGFGCLFLRDCHIILSFTVTASYYVEQPNITMESLFHFKVYQRSEFNAEGLILAATCSFIEIYAAFRAEPATLLVAERFEWYFRQDLLGYFR